MLLQVLFAYAPEKVRQAEETLGKTRSQCVDEIYYRTLPDDFKPFLAGGDGATEEGRLACVRWLWGAVCVDIFMRPEKQKSGWSLGAQSHFPDIP